jgi:hypothetical protein
VRKSLVRVRVNHHARIFISSLLRALSISGHDSCHRKTLGCPNKRCMKAAACKAVAEDNDPQISAHSAIQSL